MAALDAEIAIDARLVHLLRAGVSLATRDARLIESAEALGLDFVEV